jgi:hypothetical protein
MGLHPFQLRSRARSFGSSNHPLKGNEMALRFSIEEIVPKETEKPAFGARHDFVRQTATRQSPVLANFDRDLWSVQVSYRFRVITLGQ